MITSMNPAGPQSTVVVAYPDNSVTVNSPQQASQLYQEIQGKTGMISFQGLDKNEVERPYYVNVAYIIEIKPYFMEAARGLYSGA